MTGYNILILLLSICNAAFAANILYVIPFPAKSHYIMLRPVGIELARRGHNVTVITTHLETDPLPNYHQVQVEKKDYWTLLGTGERLSTFATINLTLEQMYNDVLWPSGLAFTELVFQSSEVTTLINNDHHFDLVICEIIFQEATFMLAHKYKAPLVLVSTFGNSMKQNVLMRNPLQLPSVIFEYLTLKDPNTFWSRLRNVYFSMYEYVWWRFWYLEKQNQIALKSIPGLSEPVPSLYEIQKNVSLVLINSHFSFDGPIAYLPNIIEIGGLHIDDHRENMPRDLQKILDDSKEGVIYANFGSNVRSSDLPLEKRDAFLKVFGRLKYTVLWIWEEDNLDNKPNNVIIKKWMPQTSILSHPNVKVFISHGGLLGTQEAIHHGVPIIGIPIYTDQYNNLLQAQEIGFGKILEYDNINEEHLYSIVSDVLNNSSYKIAAVDMSRIFKDRPLSVKEAAMYWIEYIIRNKGAPRLKNPAINMSVFTYYMLDIIGFILLVIATMVAVIIAIVRYASKTKTVISKKKKRN